MTASQAIALGQKEDSMRNQRINVRSYEIHTYDQLRLHVLLRMCSHSPLLFRQGILLICGTSSEKKLFDASLLILILLFQFVFTMYKLI